MRLKLILFIVIILSGLGRLSAQNIEYGVELDTTYMLIGDQQHLTFKVKGDAGLRIEFPQLKDTVSKGIEIISGPVRDSLKETDGRWIFQEKYVITSFDTGVYVIPAFPITVQNENYNNVLRTEPLAVIVNTFQVDEQKENYDIVMPYDTPWNFAEILPYLLWTVLGLAVIALVWWLVARSRKNKPLFKHEKPSVPPYVKAVKALDELKSEKLWQAGKVKEYYTKLGDAVRQYLDEELHIPAMEQTSLETMNMLEDCSQVEDQDKDKLAEMFRTADFVKFAKSTPLPDENSRNLDFAYDFLRNTDEKLKKEREEQQKQPEGLNENVK